MLGHNTGLKISFRPVGDLMKDPVMELHLNNISRCCQIPTPGTVTFATAVSLLLGFVNIQKKNSGKKRGGGEAREQ